MVAGFLSTSKKSARETTFLLASQRPTRTVPPQKQTRVGGREGSAMFTLEAIAKSCTASLRTIHNDFGLRGVIPLSQPHAHCPQHALIASTLSSRVSSHCWSSRDSWVGGALPYLRAAPNCCSALTTGCRTPDLSTSRVMGACSDW